MPGLAPLKFDCIEFLLGTEYHPIEPILFGYLHHSAVANEIHLQSYSAKSKPLTQIDMLVYERYRLMEEETKIS
jgi:hypothetical protein